MRFLTFALAKGRLADQTMELFEQIGMPCAEMKDNTRKLIFQNQELGLQFFLAKASDVPTYVENGAADVGIVGKDTLLEEERNLYELLDLGLGNCRMAVAGPDELLGSLHTMNNIRVATKYPRVAKNYFDERQQTVEIIRLNGSVELAPMVGLSDVIVDIVETGSTLKANGLMVLEEICPLSARLVVNRVSMKMEHRRIMDMVDRLRLLCKGVQE